MLNAKPVKTKSNEHDIKYEPIALREYEKHMHKIGYPVKVEKSGFFVSPIFFSWGVHQTAKLLTLSVKNSLVLPRLSVPAQSLM